MREIITSSPGCQLAGVATGCLVVSWIESTARSISVKLRPVCIGYIVMSLTFLLGSITKVLCGSRAWFVAAARAAPRNLGRHPADLPARRKGLHVLDHRVQGLARSVDLAGCCLDLGGCG